MLDSMIKCQTKCHLQTNDATIFFFVLDVLFLFLQYLLFLNNKWWLIFYHLWRRHSYIYVCLKCPNTCLGQRECCVYTVFMFSTLWLSGGYPGCWRSYCVLSPCPDVIYILACARCFLAALVYLPRTTASLCLHSHIAAFGVFTECVYTQYSLKCDGEKKYPLSLGFCEKILEFVFEVRIFVCFTVVSCGMPIAPVNGTVIGQDFTLGSRVTFSCNPGFRLANAQPVSTLCQESGRWSPMETRPRCVREFMSATITVLIYIKDC